VLCVTSLPFIIIIIIIIITTTTTMHKIAARLAIFFMIWNL